MISVNLSALQICVVFGAPVIVLLLLIEFNEIRKCSNRDYIEELIPNSSNPAAKTWIRSMNDDTPFGLLSAGPSSIFSQLDNLPSFHADVFDSRFADLLSRFPVFPHTFVQGSDLIKDRGNSSQRRHDHDIFQSMHKSGNDWPTNGTSIFGFY
jgi:hypothetical protein